MKFVFWVEWNLLFVQEKKGTKNLIRNLFWEIPSTNQLWDGSSCNDPHRSTKIFEEKQAGSWKILKGATKNNYQRLEVTNKHKPEWRISQSLAIIKSQDLSSLLVPSSCQSLLIASYIYTSDDSTSSYRLVLWRCALFIKDGLINWVQLQSLLF